MAVDRVAGRLDSDQDRKSSTTNGTNERDDAAITEVQQPPRQKTLRGLPPGRGATDQPVPTARPRARQSSARSSARSAAAAAAAPGARRRDQHPRWIAAGQPHPCPSRAMLVPSAIRCRNGDR